MKKEIFFHAVFLLAIGIIVYLPIYKKNSVTPAGTYYTQVHRIHEDYYYDLMVIKQGRVQFEEIDQYTTEPTRPSRVHLFYLLLGRIGGILGIPDIPMYYLGMYFSLLVFYLYTYLLLGQIIPRGFRFLGMYIIFFASPFPNMELSILGKKIATGVGWWTGMDIYSRLTLLPHHFIAIAGVVAASYYLIRFYKEKKLKHSLFSAVFLGFSILFFALPGVIFLLALTVIGVVYLSKLLKFCTFKVKTPPRCAKHSSDGGGITDDLHLGGVPSTHHPRWFLGKVQNFSKEVWLLAIGFLFIILVGLVFLLIVNRELSSFGFPWDHFLKWEYETYKAERYPLLFSVYIISYGILPFFVLSSLTQLRKPKFDYLFVFFMTIIPLFLYLLSVKGILTIPKIRFALSAPYVFGGILAMLGIIKIINVIKIIKYRRLVEILIIFLFMTNTILGLKSYWWPELFRKEVYTNIYIPKKYLVAIDYLNKNTPRYSSIMATYYVGTYLPAFSFNKVFIGHEVNTYNFWKKWEISVKFFLKKMEVDEARKIFKEHNIDFVFWDQGEIGEYGKLLTPIFQQDGITIYKVMSMTYTSPTKHLEVKP